MALLTGVDFITIATSDLEASRKFYAEVLGLEPSILYQRPSEDPIGAEFENGTVTLALLDSAKLGLEVQPNNHPIAFRVDDVHAAKAELESRGVEFTPDILDSGVCHQAFFKDPDGNALALHHRYKPRDA
jgi:catechol 2,3-dioxygenase-like lactoylglutathione lyase family enzyme